MSVAEKLVQPKVISLGCRLNIAEGARIEAMLSAAGDTSTVINTCGVTATAVRSSRAAIRKAHRDHPDGAIFVTGCAAQIEPEKFAQLPGVTGLVGNGDKFDAARYARPTIQISDVMQVIRTAPQMLPAFDNHTRAFLDVQNGCDHRCTFCIIPYGRGPSRSLDIAATVEAAQALMADGHRELVLTGVDLTSYGHDLERQPTLAQLCQRLLDAVPGLDRLRMGSIDVAEIDDALFALLTEDQRMLPHVHLSLQAGDDLILKRMKRRHSRAQAVAMVERLKSKRPEIAIGADLIAGFPTEDDAAAENSRALIADCDILFAHIFPYSPREGTPAARMPQVPPSIVKARAEALRAVAAAYQAKALAALVGTRQTLLVERDGQSGHIDNFARARIDTPETPGTILPIAITGLDGATLIGKRAA